MAASSAGSRPLPPGVGWLVLIFILACGIASASSSFCTSPQPEDYSHRQESTKRWLFHRPKHRTRGSWGLRSWSNFRKIKIASANTTDAAIEEFVEWSNKVGVSSGKIIIRKVETPWCRSESAEVDSVCRLRSFAARDIEGGETIVDFPMKSCMSDALETEDPVSLEGAPWEVRLAAKLLRERAKGELSQWAHFIQILPSYISLPLFFSNLELNNIEDWYIVEEVQLMRKFAQSVYQVLHEDEIPRVNFNEFVWALSVVYSSACKIEVAQAPSVHLLIPFFSFRNGETRGEALTFQHRSGRLILRPRDSVNRGVPLSLTSALRSTAVEFVYSGEVLDDNVKGRSFLFRDLMELVEWYVATYSNINCNRYLTLTVVQQVVGTVKSQLLELNRPADELRADFSVHSDGYINPHMFCIFATLSSVQGLIDPRSESETDLDKVTFGDLTSKEGATLESKIKVLVKECLHMSKNITNGCRHLDSGDTLVSRASLFALGAIKKRLQFLLDSFPTDLEEDNLMLAAAAWEGYARTGTPQGCPTCRWQIEQLSQNDYLAVKFRSTKKALFHDTILKLSCSGSDAVHKLSPAIGEAQVEPFKIQKFLDWCEGHEFAISNKLAIVDINVEGKGEGVTDDNKQVRGIVVVEDISHGETLSSLPLHLGLFDKGSIHVLDGWDHAAARLLRERALGNGSKWAPYIDVLPPRVPTPINLESQDLEEVQWWPVMRELVQVRKSIKESFYLLDDEATAGATLEEYQWAATIVHSRAFTLPVIDDEKYAPYVLMPFMDMINHHYHYQADWTSEPVWNGKLDIIAKRRMRKGEQLFASFGPRTNDNLFMYYGFVLDDNPWDTAPIFDSFEESIRWFLQLWGTDCKEGEIRNQLASGLCRKQRWELIWPKVGQALDNVGDGTAQLKKEWLDLVNHWADFGFQFLPYSPSPSIYAKGVIDPSLMEALATVAEFTELPRTGDACSSCTQISEALKTYFSCLGRHQPVESVAEWKECTTNLAPALSLTTKRNRSELMAELSVATRCFQVLQSLPTTIHEDRRLLDTNCLSDTTLHCSGSRRASNANLVQLTRRYRLMKKLLLHQTIDRLLNRWMPSMS